MIECVTYRMAVHTTADDPKRYRSDQEVEEWQKRDPLVRFQKYLKDKGLLTDDGVEAAEAEIKEQIQAAVDRAEEETKSLGDPMDMFNHAYAELPPHLIEQRNALARELEELQGEEIHG